MSRIGDNPIKIDNNTQVVIDSGSISVKGPIGSLSLKYLPKIDVRTDKEYIYVTTKGNDKESRSLHGLYRSLINNMVQGVNTGFIKELELRGIGYRVTEENGGLVLNLGYSHPIKIEKIDGIKFSVTDNIKIKVEGIDKQLVGQVASNIRKLRKPEPYKGKGIRFVDEVVIRKSGKSTTKGV